MTPNDYGNAARICTQESQVNEVRSFFLSKSGFCMKRYARDEDPKLLECLHAACGTSISAKLNDDGEYVDSDVVLEGNSVVCQLGNEPSQLDELIENRFHTEFINDQANGISDQDTVKSEGEAK